MSNPKAIARSLTLSVPLVITDGNFSASVTRRINITKGESVPAEIRKAFIAKLDDILAQVDVAKHTALTITYYVPKVELA